MFQKKLPPLVGVDISSSAVKLLELGGGVGGYRVKTAGMAPLPPNAVVEKEIKHLEVVGDTIRQLVKNARPSTKYAAVAVGGSSVITKIIQMPQGLSEYELEMQIEAEADRHIPFPLDEVNIHFEELGPSSSSSEYVDVLLAASRSDNVDTYIDALGLGGLDVKVVDVEAFALEKAFELVSPGGGAIMALVDIGATITNLCVIKDNQVIYTRDQQIGGLQLTEAIQRQFSMSFEEAEAAKRQGSLPENYSADVLMPFAEGLVQNISRSLQFFYSASQHSQISQVVLAGGTSQIAELREVVEGNIGIPVGLANPFSGMKISSKANEVLNLNPAGFMVSLGLALRSFD